MHLAKVLKAGGNVLLLDEPTNDLDVETLRALEEALLNFPGCAVVISHDRWFLDRIATHILAFEGNSEVVWFEGNYQDYAWSTSRRRRRRWASASAAASWACCTWRSSGSGWSASSTSTLISTAPNVVYQVTMEDGKDITVTNPSEFPGGKVAEIREPVVRATILAPSEFIGAVMELCQARRGTLLGMDYLSEDRVEMRYTLPLAEIVFDFFDQLKSKTRGYASLDYEPDRRAGRRPGQGRHPAAGRAGRRVQRDRAQGQGLRLRRADGPASCAS